jgi:hypothetical protein
MELRYQYLLTELLNRPWSEKIRFLKLVNVKYIISQQNLDEYEDLLGHVERVNPLVFRIKNPLPRAWMVGQVLPLQRGSVEELLVPSFDPSSQAIAGRTVPTLTTPGFFKQVDSLHYEKDGRIRIRTTADRPTVLVLSESSYPGWRVFVNGKEKNCLWLNLLFQGVALPSGNNEIVFEFRPVRFSGYLAVSLVSLAILWIVFFSSLSLKKRNPLRPSKKGVR